MEEFYGKHYALVSTENFDKMLIYLDKGYFQRQVALALRPRQYIACNEDGTHSLHYNSSLVQCSLQFTPGVEFNETKPDGVTVRGLITIEGNKVYHRQVEANGRTLSHVYEFCSEKMTLTSTSPGMEHVVKRHYVAVK